MPRQDCMWCTEKVGEHRIYFGVVGPFCNADCREEWLTSNNNPEPTESGCRHHWHCNPMLASHKCDGPDRKTCCPSCGEQPKSNTRQMRIGASLPVRLIRSDYETDGIDRAIATGRACFDNGDGTYGLTDGQIIAIARGEATLRGWSPPGVDYLDEPCKTCRGSGRVDGQLDPDLRLSRPGRICPTCEGDCFHPPIAESRAKHEPEGKRPEGAL